MGDVPTQGAPAASSERVGKRTLLLGIAGAVFIVDRISKLVVAFGIPPWERASLIGDVLYITHVANAGTALGFRSGERVLVVTLSLVSLALLSLLYRFLPRHLSLRWIAVALAIGGAAGNLYDRLFHADGVIDFIEVHLGQVILPIFNLADVAVVVGAFGLAASIWWDERALS